jgi:hypothetical protein
MNAYLGILRTHVCCAVDFILEVGIVIGDRFY